jgi:hypothetical protein
MGRLPRPNERAGLESANSGLAKQGSKNPGSGVDGLRDDSSGNDSSRDDRSGNDSSRDDRSGDGISRDDGSRDDGLAKRYPIALALYLVLALLVWFTMGDEKVFVHGKWVDLRLVPLIVIGGLAFRTFMTRQADRIRRQNGDEGSR